jgi:uncharacterized protein
MHSSLGSQHTDLPTPNRTAMQGRRTGRVAHVLRQGVLAALLCATGALPTLAAEYRMPPVCEPASSEHHSGKLIFVQLVTPDLAGSKQFYAGLFGWTFRDIQAGSSQYTEAYLDGRPVAGLMHRKLPPGGQRQPAWLSFFAAADVDAAKKVALQNGAKLLVEPHNVPDRGREAIFADPQGAVFAVLTSKSGDQPDVLAAPGDWIWSSLLTSDPDADAAFYQKIFDYEVFELPSDPGVEHLLLASDDYARASVNSLPGKISKAHPHWLNYVRVEDADQMTAKVVALGGRVLVAAHSDRHGGKVSVVADPQGAPFGLFEWADTESKEVTK